MDGLELIFEMVLLFLRSIILGVIIIFAVFVAIELGLIAFICVAFRKMRNTTSKKAKTVWTVLFIVGLLIAIPFAIILFLNGLELFGSISLAF